MHRLSAAVLCAGMLAAGEGRVIPNVLKQHWPHELVSMDFPLERLGAYGSVGGMGDGPRPVQWEEAERDGEAVARAWFIATVGKEPSVEVTFGDAEVPADIELTTTDGWYVVDNGVYELRVRRYGEFSRPVVLSALPHWFGGSRPVGAEAWDGKAWFTGEVLVAGARVEVLQAGPVFVDLRLTLDFPTDEVAGEIDALPLEPSKRTHFDRAGIQRRERVPATTRCYQAVLRCVTGDPWAEVVERYRLPAGQQGHCAYHLRWGATGDDLPHELIPIPRGEHAAIDTVCWTRWFEYDRFGGNNHQHCRPARPRSEQKGRPFARLQPRWTQRGGGAQEVFLTAGGSRPVSARVERRQIEQALKRRRKQVKKAGDTERLAELEGWAKRLERAKGLAEDDPAVARAVHAELAGKLGIELPGGHDYDPEAPCYGVVAAYPSKWVNPYRAILDAWVKEGRRGVDAPLRSYGSDDAEPGPRWYTQRCYALVTGPRRLFDSTGAADALVRRHSDWTLTAQVNKYRLAWEREESASGPHILMTRQRLEALRADWAGGTDTPLMRFLRAQDAGERKPKGRDAKLLALIKGEQVKPPGGPSPGMYFKRYQDDAVNPTNYGNRGMVNKRFPESDLFTVDRPFGGAETAAIGYIYSDLDAWPGWQNGWHPGNPNFHTDKYIAAVFAGAALPDHPHSDEWLDFGRRNFLADLDKVLLPPDGVGYECPGYAGYAMNLQMENARIFHHAGPGNPVVDEPLIKGTARWHRHLITPPDRRIGRRHEAPHGDTHRWDAGLGTGFAELAPFYREADPAFAAELMGTYRLLVDSGAGFHLEDSIFERVLKADFSLPATPATELDWDSRACFGFGAVLRSGFGTAQETFCSVRAGRCQGHYHNDALAFHYYADTTPIALDYNCSYHPRGDHAALHNSLTFGRTGTVLHNGRGEDVEAMEQIHGTGRVGAFASGELGSAVVAERDSRHLVLSPVDPHDSEFHRRYPSRRVGPIVHRRLLVMVEHPPGSALSDYLVVRDETRSGEAQQLNLHLLARDLTRDGDDVLLTGQYGRDILLHLPAAAVERIEQRWWHYEAGHFHSPGAEYVYRPGESQTAWAERMRVLAAERNWQSVPGPDWRPVPGKRDAPEVRAWRELIAATDGKALLPPPGWRPDARWPYGEIQLWLRVHLAPGTPLTWVLYPHPRDGERPRIETLPHGVRVTLGTESEEIRIASAADADSLVVTRGATREVLVGPLPALGGIEDVPLTGR